MSDDVIQKRTRLQLTAADFIKTDGKELLSSFLAFFKFRGNCLMDLVFLDKL